MAVTTIAKTIGLLAVLAMAGCANVPHSLDAPLTEPHPELAQVQSHPEHFEGQTVRWGGTIARVENTSEGSLVEVVARPLQSNSRPNESGMSPGRFLIATTAFLEPEVYEEGKSVTVVGRLFGLELRAIGEYEYPYPVVRASTVHLWPPRPERQATPYYDPWFYPYPYWHHPYHYYRHPYWYY